MKEILVGTSKQIKVAKGEQLERQQDNCRKQRLLSKICRIQCFSALIHPVASLGHSYTNRCLREGGGAGGEISVYIPHTSSFGQLGYDQEAF